MDLRAFDRRMKKLSGAVEKNVTRMKKRVGNALVENVVNETPVGVGTARSNWVASLNAPFRGTIDAYAPGKNGSTGAANASAAIAAARRVISGLKSGDALHVTNNLHYIGILNDGHSQQAPAGFVEAAVMNALVAARAIRLLDGVTINDD